MNQLVTLTEALVGRYTLDSYKGVGGGTKAATFPLTKDWTVLGDLVLDLAWESYPENLSACTQIKRNQATATGAGTPLHYKPKKVQQSRKKQKEKT